MNKNEKGSLNVLLISLIFTVVLFMSAAAFGVWAYMGRQDYKNNTDQKTAAAIEIAKKKLSDEKDNEFIEKEKFPLDTYKGPADFGSITVMYPKTWSAYISTNQQPEFVFNPRYVSADPNSKQAVKIQVVNTSYSDSITSYDSQVQTGALKAKAYKLPKVSKVVGLRFDGQISEQLTGSVVVLPLRDKTIIITNEVPNLRDDFDKIILENLTFIP